MPRKTRKDLTDAPERLTDEQRERIKVWAERKWPKIVPQLGNYWSRCRDWHLSNGVQRADWEATFRVWMRREEGIAGTTTSKDQRRDTEHVASVTPLLDWSERKK